MNYLKSVIAATLILLAQACTEEKQSDQTNEGKPLQKTENMEQLKPEDYTTFKVIEKVTMYAVTFKNQYQMEVAGHLFIPNNLDRKAKNPAIIVGHPMGAVKEQSADVYASNMADRGFIT